MCNGTMDGHVRGTDQGIAGGGGEVMKQTTRRKKNIDE